VRTTTDAEGNYAVRYDFPEAEAITKHGIGYENPCRAYHSMSRTYSPFVDFALVYDTRLSIEAPDAVGVCESYTISGKLEYRYYDAERDIWEWRPLAGKTVRVLRNTTVIGTPTTGTDGSYSVSDHIPETGTYTLSAQYAGYVPAGSLYGQYYAPARVSRSIRSPPPIIPPELIIGTIIAAVGLGGVYLIGKYLKWWE